MNNDNFAFNEKPNLTNCDREPIHIPGSIQPHGAILTIDDVSLKILQTSVNSAEMLGFAPAQLLGESFEKFFTAESVAQIKKVAAKNIETAPHYLPPLETVSGVKTEAIIHRYQDALILELEAKPPTDSGFSFELYAALKSTLARLEQTLRGSNKLRRSPNFAKRRRNRCANLPISTA